MSDHNFLQGYAKLLACLKDRDLTPEIRKVRGQEYKNHLGHLTDEAWDYAVNAVISAGHDVRGESAGWFPTVDELLAHAVQAPRPRAIERHDSGSADDYWRRSEGSSLRKVNGHESDPDPDWSLPEISRDRAALATEFLDWLFERGSRSEGFDALFENWIGNRWQAPLSSAAKSVLLFAVKAQQRGQLETHLPFKTHAEQSHYEGTVRGNPRRVGEGPLAYIERLAVIAGGVQPGEGFLDKQTAWFDNPEREPIAELAAGAHLSAPARDFPEVRMPYREAE